MDRSGEEVPAMSLLFSPTEPVRPLVGGVTPYARPQDQRQETGNGRQRRKRPDAPPADQAEALGHPQGGEDVDRYV